MRFFFPIALKLILRPLKNGTKEKFYDLFLKFFTGIIRRQAKLSMTE